MLIYVNSISEHWMEKKLSEVKKLIDKSSKPKNEAFVEYGAEDEFAFQDRVKTTFCKYFQSGEDEILLVSHGTYGKRAYEIFYDKKHGFQNAEHAIFDPALIDVAGKCGLIDLDL